MADSLNRSDGEDPSTKPGRRERGRMRRRLRRQQRVREALLLDLGALVYDMHRQGRREPELLQAKAAQLNAVDDEVRALGEALEERQPLGELAAADIAGSCETCGAVLTSDARFCSHCGAPARPGAAGGPEMPEREIATPGNSTAIAEDEPAALEATDELHEPGPEPEPPPPYEPLADRAGGMARSVVRRGRDWLDRRRRRRDGSAGAKKG